MFIQSSRLKTAIQTSVAAAIFAATSMTAVRQSEAAPSSPPDQHTSHTTTQPPPQKPGEMEFQPPRITPGHGDIPPMIVYPGSRRSSGVIEGIAVDKGIEWQGVKAYIGLTTSLVVVDSASGKTLWTGHGSGFYDTLTFRNISTKDEKARWAIRLRSSIHSDAQLDAYYELRTGKEIRLPEQENRPEGEPFRLAAVWSGAEAVNDNQFVKLISKSRDWEDLRQQMFGDDPVTETPEAGDIDFEKHMLLVVSSGRASNCRGISYASAYNQEAGMLIRLQYFTYQSAAIFVDPSAGGNRQGPAVVEEQPVERPYGLFLIPRTAGSEIRIERNNQRYIGGPPIWKPFFSTNVKSTPKKPRGQRGQKVSG